MPRKAKSQWNFGELFANDEQAGPTPAAPAEPARTIRSVSELTTEIKRLLNREIGDVWVSGEITNFRMQGSGHIYFTVKDAGAQLSCVLFRGQRIVHRQLLEDGQKVLLKGEITVYEARGQYQLIVSEVELQGIGALQLAFERLKQKLQAEGLFETDRKRSIPRYPQRIGIVTSPTGAAIRDVLHVIGRRHPALEIILAPCRVQGDGAAKEIARAIEMLSTYGSFEPATETGHRRQLDLILVTRGGGSLEDLWAFNEEVVARAIAASAIPVVSAVGHEIDFSIADFVADLRAATPSAGAELITEGAFSSREFIADTPGRLTSLLRAALGSRKDDLENLAHRLVLSHPRRRLNEHAQRLDDLCDAVGRTLRVRLRESVTSTRYLRNRLAAIRPRQAIELRRQRLKESEKRLRDCAHAEMQRAGIQLSSTESRLELLSPLNTLNRGYSITTDAATGKIVRRASDVQPGTRLRSRLASGELLSRVEDEKTA